MTGGNWPILFYCWINLLRNHILCGLHGHKATFLAIRFFLNVPLLLSSMQGKYNHGNDIKELANAAIATLPVSSRNFPQPDQNGSCSSISGSVSTADAVNYHGSSASSSGQSSTANILSSDGGGGGAWNKMQQRCTWRYAMDLFVVLACKLLLLWWISQFSGLRGWWESTSWHWQWTVEERPAPVLLLWHSLMDLI